LGTMYNSSMLIGTWSPVITGKLVLTCSTTSSLNIAFGYLLGSVNLSLNQAPLHSCNIWRRLSDSSE
jgi:glycerol-3-phosphate dehydrogenase